MGAEEEYFKNETSLLDEKNNEHSLQHANSSEKLNEEASSVDERAAIITQRKNAVGINEEEFRSCVGDFLELLHDQDMMLLANVQKYPFTAKERAVQEFLLLTTVIERKLRAELVAAYHPDISKLTHLELQSISAHIAKATALAREYVRRYNRMKEAFLKAGYGDEAKGLLAAFAATEKALGLFLEMPSPNPAETAKETTASQPTLSAGEQQRMRKHLPPTQPPASPKNYAMSAFGHATASYAEALSDHFSVALTQHVEKRTISDRLKSLVRGKLSLATTYIESWETDFLINGAKPTLLFNLLFNKVSDADIRKYLLRQIASFGPVEQEYGYVSATLSFLLSLDAQERSMLLLKTTRNVLKIGMLTYREKFISFPYFYCICTIDPFTARYRGVTHSCNPAYASMGVNVSLVMDALTRLAVRARTEAGRMAGRDASQEQILSTLTALLDGYVLTDPHSPELAELQQLCGEGPLGELYKTLGVHEPTHAADTLFRTPCDARDVQLLVQSRGDVRLYYFYDFVRGCRAESLTRMRDTAPRVGREEVGYGAYAVDAQIIEQARQELRSIVTASHKKVESLYKSSHLFSARYAIGQYMLLMICLERLAEKGRWQEITLVAIAPDALERIAAEVINTDARAAENSAPSTSEGKPESSASSISDKKSESPSPHAAEAKQKLRTHFIDETRQWFPVVFASDGRPTANGERYGLHAKDVRVIADFVAVGELLKKEGVLLCSSIPVDVLEECIATVAHASPREFMVLFDGAAQRLGIPKELQVLSLSMFVTLTAAARATHEAEVKRAGGYVFPQLMPFG